jgi:hypothetical protein
VGDQRDGSAALALTPAFRGVGKILFGLDDDSKRYFNTFMLN